MLSFIKTVAPIFLYVHIAAGLAALIPVSYTHLTLPTIYSV